MRIALARIAVVVVAALVAVLFYAPLGHVDYLGNWLDGSYGVTLPSDGTTQVIAVTPGSPAALAGIGPGDRGELSAFSRRWGVLRAPSLGERLRMRFVRPNGTQYAVSMRARAVAGADWQSRASGFLGMIPATIFFAIALGLAILRPGIMTFAFFAYAIGYFSTAPIFEYFYPLLPHAIFLALACVMAVAFGNLAVLPLLPFVLRFPSDDPVGWRRIADRIMWVLLPIAYAFEAYAWWHLIHGAPVPWQWICDEVIPLATFAAAGAIVVAAVKAASPADRQRLAFLSIGVVMSFVAYAVYFIPGISRELAQIVGYGVVLMPISVAYAALRHRVLGVSFVLNRAATYGALSVAVLAFVSILDWLLSLVVSATHLATILTLLATIAIGFLLDRINRGIGSGVEAVLFRRRRAAELYLRRSADALQYATDENAIADALTNEPVEALELTAAALYRRSPDGASLRGAATARGTTVAPPSFEMNHRLVRLMQADERELWLDDVRSVLDPETTHDYALALPILLRHQLVGIVLYGAHRDGTQIDPDEVALLHRLVREAARAYDHVDAVRLRAQLQRFMVAT
ncbi:MAG TPA: hypothetical protein VMV73_04745 [Candidatus Dormibacteraeota bacterium]|nr:hypothetical protein [Candidatus Dormibacteraeota bacterium]